MEGEFLYGINTVSSLIAANSGKRKIFEIILNSGKVNSSRIREVISKAEQKNIHTRKLEPNKFAGFAADNFYKEEIESTQGIIAHVSNYSFKDFEQITVKNSGDGSVFIILDEITDVGNFGAILRNCSAFNVAGVIISKNRSVEVNRRVSKISSGALEEVNLYRVTNISRAIDELKRKGFWIYGTTLQSNPTVKLAHQVDFTFPLAVVLGSEDKGIGRLTEEKCDVMVRIDMPGTMQSLNVATAAGIMLYIITQHNKKTAIKN
ncbi:MAG: 23S rRNA (guanosine(2251)-2'-O)-methyltransferase RlmB [Actinobacteria bacterium]|nr:23S rRNA (guanosine(2251)-2'-O)-methyltransferase RlmB [Actinomycetota bacterium]